MDGRNQKHFRGVVDKSKCVRIKKFNFSVYCQQNLLFRYTPIYMLLFRLKKNGEVMKGQYKYIKLNNNRKTISVGEWTSDKTNPSTEELDPRLQVIIVYMMSPM